MQNKRYAHGRGVRFGRRHCQYLADLFAISETGGEESASDVDVGLRLRQLRTERSLSIRALAEMSGLNFNTLSLIENGKTSPSVSTLQQLARALGAPLTAFFERLQPPRQVVFQKAGGRPRASFAYGLLEDLGDGLTLAGGQPLLVTMKPGADSGPDPILHTGHEFVFCLDGCLTYQVAGQEYTLEPGDSLLFEAHLPHCWRNPNPFPSRSLLVLCPADENDSSTEPHFTPEAESLP
jgi:transcriptional regulator with XRE-family HTH domain